jgi:hypothetical protein
MNCDVAFAMGRSHRVCQDYARCNTTWRDASMRTDPLAEYLPDGKPYIILADGCSSSQDSDFGSRLLVKYAENFLGHPDFHASVIAAADATAKSMGLADTALDATLLTARYTEQKCDGIEVSVYGDGVVAAKDKDGKIEVASISYPSGYPRYLSYSLSEKRTAHLLSHTQGNKRQQVHYNILPDGTVEEVLTCSFDDPVYSVYVPAGRYEWVALFSDGVFSFQGDDAPKMTDVVKKLTTFKGAIGGEFVQRSLNVLMRECKEKKWTHYDDLSVGVIYLK